MVGRTQGDSQDGRNIRRITFRKDENKDSSGGSRGSSHSQVLPHGDESNSTRFGFHLCITAQALKSREGKPNLPSTCELGHELIHWLRRAETLD